MKEPGKPDKRELLSDGLTYRVFVLSCENSTGVISVLSVQGEQLNINCARKIKLPG